MCVGLARRLMRLGLATTLAASTLAACAGGYPLAPTRCDHWCDATRGGGCFEEDYDPSGCVASCELTLMNDQSCAPALDALIECYRAHPQAAALRCEVTLNRPCLAEDSALALCATQL